MERTAYQQLARFEDRHWWYAGRRRIVESLLVSTETPTPARILEVGAGSGGNLPLLARFGEVTALELDPESLAIAQGRGIGKVMAGHLPDGMPAELGKFDLICMLDVLEHLEDDRGGLESVASLLKPAGRILCTVPAYQWLFGPHDEAHHHHRRYDLSALRSLASSASLETLSSGYFNTLLFPFAAGARLYERARHSGRYAGASTPPTLLNDMLRTCLAAEAGVLRYASLPFGLSAYAVFTQRGRET